VTGTHPPNVLLSSGGRRVGLLEAFRASLIDLEIDGRVFVADASPLSAAAHLADASFAVPPCTHPDYVPRLLELCRSQAVGLVVPTIDPELPVLAAAREELAAAGTAVLVSSPEVVSVGADKVLTHDWLTTSGLPTVRQAGLPEAREERQTWRFPFLVKPRFGSASQDVSIVHDLAQLDAIAGRGDLLAQSIAAGVEHTIDLLVDRQGQLVCAVPRQRLEVRGGEVSKSVTRRVPELIDLAAAVVDALPGAWGPLTLQAFWEEATGTAAIIELNPRFGGGFPLSWAAGARYPRWILEESHALPSTAAADGWRAELVMLRYDDAVFVEATEVGLA
jgi:carbamoyl-phosphate synthase large subunit